MERLPGVYSSTESPGYYQPTQLVGAIQTTADGLGGLVAVHTALGAYRKVLAKIFFD